MVAVVAIVVAVVAAAAAAAAAGAGAGAGAGAAVEVVVVAVVVSLPPSVIATFYFYKGLNDRLLDAPETAYTKITTTYYCNYYGCHTAGILGVLLSCHCSQRR